MTWVKRGKGWRRSCDVGEATESLENELFRFSYVIGFSLTSPGEPPMFRTKRFKTITNFQTSCPSSIQGGRVISAIFLTVVGDGSNDQKMYIQY